MEARLGPLRSAAQMSKRESMVAASAGAGSEIIAAIAAPAAKIDQRMMLFRWVVVCLMSASLVSRSPSDLVAVIVYQPRDPPACARFTAMVTHFTTAPNCGLRLLLNT